MDKVVLVAEAEKSSRDVVKRAKLELSSVGASISVILNKVRLTRQSGPERKGEREAARSEVGSRRSDGSDQSLDETQFGRGLGCLPKGL